MKNQVKDFCPFSVPQKFECLRDAVCKPHSTEAELTAAWSKLTEAETKELLGEEDGTQRGKMEFDERVEYAPLHGATYFGNTRAVQFLLVCR